MADEAIEEEESGNEGSWRGILLPVLISALTATAVGGAMWFYFFPKMQKQQQEQAQAAAETQAAQIPAPADDAAESVIDQAHTHVKHTGLYHQYDSFVVSIFDREKVHYLRIKVALELSNQAVSDEITIKDPQIKDAMIFVLGDFTVRELLDNQAKLLVKDVLLKTLGKILGTGKVIDVYFTEFVVQ
jgi:flagellar FliL protein